MPIGVLKNSEFLKTQYDMSSIVERQCSYCSYAFALYIDELLPNINLKERSLNEKFIENYNDIIENASYVKKTSPFVNMMETFNSDYSQNCFNIYPDICHMILNPHNLKDYEPMHDLYRSQFINWQDVHNTKLATPRINDVIFIKLLEDLVNHTSKLSFLIVNRFFMTFLIIPISKTFYQLNKMNELKCTDDDTNVNTEDYLILDSHYKSVYILDKNEVFKYVNTSSDYNLVLIGKIYDSN